MIATNHDLYRLYQEYNQMKNSLYFLLMPSRVKEFRKNNDHKYNSLIQDQNKIYFKYFEFDEKGQILYTETEGEDGKIKKDIKLLPGKSLEDYNKEFSELMDTKINIHI